MTSYRHALPQLSDRITLTDGGIETTLIYHEGIELPHFAAFVLLELGRLRNFRLLYHEGEISTFLSSLPPSAVKMVEKRSQRVTTRRRRR